MSDSRRYRQNAAECLLAYEARQPCYGKLNISIAALWLGFANQDEAIDNLLASWGMAEPYQKWLACSVACDASGTSVADDKLPAFTALRNTSCQASEPQMNG
jgi:hypothetical protein